MKSKNFGPDVNRPRRRIAQQASSRGIYAVRRNVAEESYDTIRPIVEALRPELENAVRIFDIRGLGLTVVGFSRFGRRHKGKGPSTAAITERVPSASRQLEIGLGSLAVYGSEVKKKLGIEVLSPELAAEEAAYSQEFKRSGYPLNKDPNSPEGYFPHLSLSLLYNDHSGHFEDERTISVLNKIAGLGECCGVNIVLDPVEHKDGRS